MNIDNLAGGEEDTLSTPNEIYADMPEMSARTLAYHFRTGTENQRMIYRDFLRTQSEGYREEFNEYLEDPFLSERKEEDSETESETETSE